MKAMLAAAPPTSRATIATGQYQPLAAMVFPVVAVLAIVLVLVLVAVVVLRAQQPVGYLGTPAGAVADAEPHVATAIVEHGARCGDEERGGPGLARGHRQRVLRGDEPERVRRGA